MPIGCAFIGMTRSEDHALAELSANKLHTDGHTRGGKSTWYTQRRDTSKIERLGKDVIGDQSSPFLTVNFIRVF